MRKTTLLFFTLIILLSSCGVQKSSVAVKNSVENQIQAQHDLLQKLTEADKKREEKLLRGELDSQTDSLARNYISQLRDSVNNRLAFFNALVNTTYTRKKRAEITAYLNQTKDSYKKELDNILFFDELFDASTFSRLNTAAFFGAGEYQLSPGLSKDATLVMQQILKDAMDFAAKHSSRKLRAMFIVEGYADEQEISPGSALHKDLSQGLDKSSISGKRLNYILSSRRASTIKNLLKTEYDLLTPVNNAGNIDASFIPVGKGEELPKGTITNYKSVDERRRVVLLYWSIIPDLH